MAQDFRTQENFNVDADGRYVDRPHVLVIDDDERIRSLVSRYLKEQGFVCLGARDTAHARELLAAFDFDVLVVDVMMPGQTGLEFTQELRAQHSALPVLLLTALGETEDRIDGLEAGADDYLPKPFEPRELVLRLNAILRRSGGVKKSPMRAFKIGDWAFDAPGQLLKSEDGQSQKLTAGEVSLIKALAAQPGEVLSREKLAKACGLSAAERTIDVQVTRLRRKIEEDTKHPRYLQTIRGKGYLLRVEEIDE